MKYYTFCIKRILVGQRPQSICRENEGYLGTLERGRTRKSKATREHRTAHRNVV